MTGNNYKMLARKIAAPVALLVLCSASVQAEKGFQGAKDWVSGAPDEFVRDKRLEQYLRGFDQPMWEVGERYERMEQALLDDNYELAQYHWKKIKITINNGLMKRPARRANAEAILLDSTWQQVKEALVSKDPVMARQGFAQAKAACMACHAAEKVAYMNQQPMFQREGYLKVADDY